MRKEPTTGMKTKLPPSLLNKRLQEDTSAKAIFNLVIFLGALVITSCVFWVIFAALFLFP